MTQRAKCLRGRDAGHAETVFGVVETGIEGVTFTRCPRVNGRGRLAADRTVSERRTDEASG